jgi:hypothetical protein
MLVNCDYIYKEREREGGREGGREGLGREGGVACMQLVEV